MDSGKCNSISPDGRGQSYIDLYLRVFAASSV